MSYESRTQFSLDGLLDRQELGLDRFAYMVRGFRLVWDAAKRWTVAWAVLLLIQGLMPAASVYLTKVLVDTLGTVIGTGFSWESVQPLVLPGSLMVGVMLLTQVASGFTAWVRKAQSELIKDHVKGLIHEKAGEVDLEFYETPGYFDLMARANSQAESRSMSLLENLGSVIQNGITLVSIAGLLIPYGIWIPFALFISTLPALWVVVQHNLIHHDWWQETTEKRRWADYYDKVLTFRFAAPEVRIFDLNDHFQGLYRELRTELRNGRLRLLRDQNLARLWAGFASLFVTGVTMAWIIWRSLQGAASLGDLTLFYQSFNRGRGIMSGMLSSAGRLYTDASFLEHLFDLLELEPNVTSPANPRSLPPRSCYGIEISDVSFRYPGSDELAVSGLNLSIPKGSLVAVVGPNGAGKSTLIRLLCRFYDPTTGSVTIDGVDIRDLRVDDLHDKITVLFQRYVNYAGTVRESIEIGDRWTEYDEDRLELATEVGLARKLVRKLPRGYDTLLGKQFEKGTELSGGQWQRIALSRTFYRDAPIVLLDEPTSYMDSWAEHEWLDKFCNYVADRTAVIVTHRFTTAMRADLIYVMDDGNVIESGSHEDLIAEDGPYAASWKAQRGRAEGLSINPSPDIDRNVHRSGMPN